MRNKFLILLLMFFVNSNCTESNIAINMKAEEWKKITIDLLNISNKNYTNLDPIQTNSNLALTYSILYGWESEEAQYQLQILLDKVDKFGYGVGVKWDAFQDKTINDEYTNYTVTMTDHVGLTYLDAFKKGFLKKERLLHLINTLGKVPYADTLSNGKCIAYSDNKNDIVGCVHNVNIGYAFFFNEVENLAIAKEKSYKGIINSILEREKYSFIENVDNYYYWDRSKSLTDQNHLAYQAWCMVQFNDNEIKEIGGKIINSIEKKRKKDISSLIGQLRLLSVSNYESDSLLSVLKNLINRQENEYIPMGVYTFDNARVSSQLALWSAKYYEKIR